MSGRSNESNRGVGPGATNRRRFLGTGLALAAASLLPRNSALSRNHSAAYRQMRSAQIGRRTLGGSLEVSALGLGCMSMRSGSYNPPRDPQEMIPVIRGAVDAA